jgi:hypothetical protein
MNPMLMTDHGPAPATARRNTRWFQRLGGIALMILKFIGRVMFARLFRRSAAPELRIEEGTRFTRFVRSVLYRLAFVPCVIVLFVVALVFAVTHAPPAPVDIESAVLHGVYYEPIEITALDQTRLEAWLVPVYDAKRLVMEKDHALKKKHHAIVLAHDQSSTKEQMIPLIKPLHDAGMVVLVLGMRGTGPSKSAGHTFGLKEALDVRAGIAALRQRTYVDPGKISVLGIGTGANAAMVAAAAEGRVAALVLSRPVDGFEQAFTNRVGNDKPWLKWITPMCQWTFEAMYHVDADDLNVHKFANLPFPTLRLDASGLVDPWEVKNIDAVCEFLRLNNAAPTDVFVTLPNN